MRSAGVSFILYSFFFLFWLFGTIFLPTPPVKETSN